MTAPILCPPHQARVVVGDRAVLHEADGTPCHAERLVRGGQVLTPAQVRAEQERGPDP